MQVEIKLRLKDETAHQRVAEALRPHLITTHKQENIFYDGSEKELSKERVIIRTRFYNTDKRCLLTIKVLPLPTMVALPYFFSAAKA